MLHITDLRNTDYDPATVMPRAKVEIADASEVVEPIIDKVKSHGAEAVLDFTERFDAKQFARSQNGWVGETSKIGLRG